MVKMKTVLKYSTILFLAATLSIVGSSQGFAKKRFVPKRPGEVIFLRGLANIFSLGLDTLSAEVRKYGVNSYTKNHKAWKSIGNSVILRYKNGQLKDPIIIVGHSLGAGAAPKLATMLGKKNIKVHYMVMLDAVEPLPLTNFVQEAINYFLPKKKGNNLASSSKNFTGEYTNVNVKERLKGIDHFNIDENEILRGQITRRIFELVEIEEAKNKK